MISGKGLKKILDYSFAGGTAFLAPTASFMSSPSEYTVSSVPGTVTLSGNIILNDGTGMTWTITNAVGTVLASGATISVSHNLVSIPSGISSNIYNLNVTYINGGGTSSSFSVPTTVAVTADALIGQLPLPSDNIIIPGDLVPFIGGLTVTTQSVLINIFNINAVNTGRIVLVIPYSFGTISTIEDGAGLDVLSQFNVIDDPTNNRVIYSGINTVTPALYNYKIIF